MRTADSLTVPRALAKAVQEAAREEHRPVADVLRDAIDSYLEKRDWQLRADQEHASGQALGLPDDAMPLTPEYRQTLRAKIDQGLRSLREGRAADGEAFFAQMEAEFEDLARHGRP